MEKYNILPAEVDAGRLAVGLPPLYEDNNFHSTTTLQNINEATRREIDEVAKQQRLIVELEQNQDKLRERDDSSVTRGRRFGSSLVRV